MFGILKIKTFDLFMENEMRHKLMFFSLNDFFFKYKIGELGEF